MKTIFKLFFWVYILLILVVSLTPSSGIETINMFDTSFRIDYSLHIIGFFILPILGFISNGYGNNLKFWGLFLAISLVLAIGTEVLQILVPGRKFNPLDVLSNFIGLISGIIFVLLFLRKKTIRISS
jgi:VanZ family protein